MSSIVFEFEANQQKKKNQYIYIYIIIMYFNHDHIYNNFLIKPIPHAILSSYVHVHESLYMA